MQHFNSSEERAKREAAQAAGLPRSPGFRHYNSPEEVAKRKAASIPSAPIAPAARAVSAPQKAPEAWPPAGQDNTASVVVDNPATLATPPAPAGSLPDLTVDEYRELRRILNNFSLVEELLPKLSRRVHAIEIALSEPDPEPATPDDANERQA